MYSTKYWNTYYETPKETSESSFANFCLDYVNVDESILDICCGDGRDSIFFKDNKLIPYSFDLHEQNKDLDINYTKYDLNSRLDNFSINPIIKFDHVYCRFVLHAVPEKLEDYILVNSNSSLKKDGFLFIEVRSDKGSIPNIIDDHYRRLINIDVLKSKLKNLNFDIIYSDETDGLSCIDKEDPVLIRIVAKKRGEPNVYSAQSFHDVQVIVSENDGMNKSTAKHLLETTKKIFDFNDITFLLVFGTLLGAYREKDFIDNDEDVDVAILHEYRERIVKLINAGYFKMYGIVASRSDQQIISLNGLNGEVGYIDFYFFADNFGKYTCARHFLTKEQYIPSKITFLGKEYNTVSDPEEYLKSKYGENWKIPAKFHAIY